MCVCQQLIMLIYWIICVTFCSWWTPTAEKGKRTVKKWKYAFSKHYRQCWFVHFYVHYFCTFGLYWIISCDSFGLV